MAIKDCDKLSNIVTTSIIAGDDELAQEIAGLSLQKRTALARAKNIDDVEGNIDILTGLSIDGLKTKAQAADAKLEAIISAKVLNGNMGVEAYAELAKKIAKGGGTAAGGLELLEKVRNADIADYSEVARLWGDPNITPTEIFGEIESRISNYTAAQYSLRNTADLGEKISKINAKLSAGELTKKQAKKEIDDATKQAYQNIKEGKNPTGYARIDEEWQAIKKISGGNAEEAAKARNQYVMAKALIGYNDDIVGLFEKAGLENLTGKLTINQIQEYGINDLDKLLARAFTNTQDLYEDALLRQAYKEKLTELVSSGNLSGVDDARIGSLVRAISFADEGATFSQILKYNTIWNNARRRGLDVSGIGEKEFYHSLQKYVRNLSEDISKIPDVIEIAGVKMQPIDLIQLIYDATGDKNIIKLINVGDFSDTAVLDVATQYFVGNNDSAAKKIVALFGKAKETSQIDNVQDLILKTLTGNDIAKDAPKGFFDYRKGMYQRDELNGARADFMDALANKNSIRVPGEIEDFTKYTEEGALYTALQTLKGGYLFVNDIAYKDNALLRKVLNKLDEEGANITVLSPNKILSANFTIDNGNLVFRTIHDDIFDEVAGRISIQTLGEANPTQVMIDSAETLARGANEGGESAEAIKAMEKYNDAMNNAAVKYFGEMLGLSGKKVDRQYVDRVNTLLSEKTGIDLKAFSQIKNKSKLRQMVDEKFSLAKLTAGKYDTVIEDVGAELRRIDAMSNQQLADDMALNMGDIINPSNIINNIKFNQIKEAYKDFRTAGSAIDSLTSKGRIISLMNGGSAQTMSINDIQNMFQNRTFKNIYKEMFFANQDVSDEVMNGFINQINDNIFDGLSIQFAENLVSAGYDLPLINIKGIVYDYLNGTVDLNSRFVQAFITKNNLPTNTETINGLLNSFMPSEFRFGYENSLYKVRGIENGQKSVFREGKNRFVQDSYSALATIEAVKLGKLPQGDERKILEGILDKYIDEFDRGMASGIKFSEAQALKQEAAYALDMLEQDFLEPRYGQLLTAQERQQLMGMKYLLPIGVSGQNATVFREELERVKKNILDRYDRTLKNVAKNNDINMKILKGEGGDTTKMQKKIDARKELLKENGAVIKEIGGQYVVYDSRQALKETLDNLPNNIYGFEGLKNLTNAQLRELSNEQVYGLLKYAETAKILATRADFVTELIYKQNPMLLKYAFFETFYVVDGLPRALKANALSNAPILREFDNTSIIDETIKKGIFKKIKSQFNKVGYLDMSELKKIISETVSDNEEDILKLGLSPSENKKIFDSMNVTYQNAFTPYTYLRDIPRGGTLSDGTTLIDVKGRVEQLMKESFQQTMADLESLGIDSVNKLPDNITIKLNSGEELSLKDLANYNIDSWKKTIFNDENTFVEAADRVGLDLAGDSSKKATAEIKEFRERISNSYNSTLQAMLNGTQIITEAEAKLTTAFMRDVRTLLRKGSLTNMIADAADALSGINEEAARGIKDYLIGWKGVLSFGSYARGDIGDRLKEVQRAYEEYYYMPFEKMGNVRPTTQAEDLALRLAKYFRNLERYLGSVDGATGCTTKTEINRAFYNIGETFLNVRDTRGVFGMLSAIEQNQILKFFKFSEDGQASYVAEFKRNRGMRESSALGGYRDYVTDIIGIDVARFNEIFGSTYNDSDFKKILQGLSGFTISHDGRGRYADKILTALNGSHFVFRFLMSYPGQLLTIPQQGAAYFLKQIGFERELGVESLSDIDAVRVSHGTLEGAYNELPSLRYSTVSPDDLNPGSYYNRYGLPDVERIYKNTSIETSDDYLSMYAKIDDYASSNANSISRWFRQLDPYKDNANNIIDGLFARNFKNIAFAKAIRENDFMQFTSARAFNDFMNDPTVSASVKERLMGRINAYSGRNFRNILGLGFGGLDMPVAGSGFGNIAYGLMQLINFRGSWGQNIFKQTGANIITMLKMVGTGNMGAEGREAIARFVATQPEFLNFVQAAFNDIKWTWRLQRFQDNGQWPGEGYYDILDFIEYFTATLNMTSQRYQGIQSFGPARPFVEQGQSILASMSNPTVYKDTFGVGAFFNALGKNVGRQRKPVNWIVKAAGARTTDGWAGFEAFVQNKFWELSFGSLRYMVNEDENSYGYTYELIGQRGGIPSIIMGEAPLNSDKVFGYELDNTETWKTMQMLASGDVARDDKRAYAGNLWKAFVNGSQLISLPKNVTKALQRRAPSYFTSTDLSEALQSTEAGREFYQRGMVTPSTPEEARLFVDYILKNGQYRPGSTSFNKSIVQFDSYGHMNGKEKGNVADAEMELWLEHMKYETDENGVFIKSGGKKKIDTRWTNLMEDIKSHFYNPDYVANITYNYAQQWLDEHSSDPNYNLYLKMLGQGHATQVIKQRENEMLDYLNASAGRGAKNRWNKTEFENSGQYDEMLLEMGNSKLVGDDITFFERLNILDADASTAAGLLVIREQMKNEGDRKTLDRFFNVSTGDDGVESIELKSQYKSLLTQMGSMAKALDAGNLERFRAESSSLVHQFKNDDPTGIVTATLIDSVFNRINDSTTLSPEQKGEAFAALFHDNKEYIQKNPEIMREMLGDDYNTWADYMNKMLYQRDGTVISNLESIQSSGSKSSSSAGGRAAKLSNEMKKLSLSYGGDGYKRTYHGRSGEYKQWVPVKVQGASLVKELGVKGYVPGNIKAAFKGFSPNLDLSINKDIKRKIKTTKSQAVSSKKQISKITEKTTKATEVED